MRSFTKKNTEYTSSKNISGTVYATGNSLYQLMYTAGANNHIQSLQNAFETPVFKKAAKALISLVVQWKKNEYELRKPGSILNIKNIIDVEDVKSVFTTLCGIDYIVNSNGPNSLDLFASPQAGKTIDFSSIKNTDGVKFPDIEKLYINTQFFSPDKIKDTLKKAPFDLDKAPYNIPDIVLKNAASLLVLMQVLAAVKVRSRYENLYGFKYPNPVGTDNIKLNYFVYRSAVPISQGIITSLQTAVNEAKKVKINKSKTPQSKPLVNTALAIQETARLFKNFIDNNTSPNANDKTRVENFSNTITDKPAGRKKAEEAIEILVEAIDLLIKKAKFEDCTKKVFEGIKIAVAVCAIVGKSKPANDNTNTKTNNSILSTIIEKIKEGFKSLKTQFKDQAPINSDKFKTNPIISNFNCKTPGTAIVGAQNPLITALAPGHVRFIDTFNVVVWTRQGMTGSEGAGLSIVPFDEGEKLVNGYINSKNRDTIKDSIEKQGKALLDYIFYHYKTSADHGYRYAKKTMIFKQGLYCAFCETPFADARVADIEHKLPKSIFPSQALNWNNFVLCCKVCNSDFKKEKYITGKSVENDGTSAYLDNPFDSRAVPGAKNYLECKEIAVKEVLWPDKKHDLVNGVAAHNLLSFQAVIGSKLPTITLASVQAQTYASVHTKPAIGGKTNRIDIKGLANGVTGDDVSIVFQKAVGLPVDVNKIGVGASVEHIISICGLDKTGKSYWNDQRIVSRTRAWLNAMKQFKILAEFSVDKFKNLYTFYQEQLHPANIKHIPAAPNQSRINELRDTDVAANNAIQLDTIKGALSIATGIANGKVNIDLATSNATTSKVSINGKINVNDNFIFNQGSLTGEIKEVSGKRTITGSINLQTKIPAYNTKDNIILFKDVEVSAATANPTQIKINDNQGIISDAVDLLKNWDNNRADLLQLIEQTGTILKDYIWENVIDMVRFGGYYSTWVRTFQDNTQTGNEIIPYALDLVKRLEVKALENQEDPFQYHGTDAEEIMAGLI